MPWFLPPSTTPLSSPTPQLTALHSEQQEETPLSTRVPVGADLGGSGWVTVETHPAVPGLARVTPSSEQPPS